MGPVFKQLRSLFAGTATLAYQDSIRMVVLLACVMGLLVHGALIAAFLAMGLAPMAWHSVIAMCCWVWAAYWTVKARLGIATAPVFAELYVYVAQTTYYFGYEAWAPLVFFTTGASLALLPLNRWIKVLWIVLSVVELWAIFTFIEGPARSSSTWELIFIRGNSVTTGFCIMYVLVGYLAYLVRRAEDNTRAAHARNDELLRNILPKHVIEALAATGKTPTSRHNECSILFTDFARFTQTASTMQPERMVQELNEIFAAFDEITADEGVEKIKTIGDAYMAAAGLAAAQDNHAQRCVNAALRMQAFMEQRNVDAAFKWQLRVGVHSGPVVSGVVGKHKYAFDIWGDSVNIAARMESASEPGRVNILASTYDLIRKDFTCTYRGKLDAKGKGEVDMYFVEGHRA